MSVPRVSLSVATSMHQTGQPFVVRYEYVGYNSANQSRHSSKFWQIEGNGRGPVTVRWGRIGSTGQSQTKTWSEAQAKAWEKESEGYVLAHGSLRTVPPPAAQPPPPSLAGPFAQIARLVRHPDGNYSAYDKSGTFLFQLTRSGAFRVKASNPAVQLA